MKCDFTNLGIGCLIMIIVTGSVTLAYSYYETNIDITALEHQAKGYNKIVSDSFNYNISNHLNFNLTDAQLLQEGATCWRWSEFYATLARNDGLNATLVTFTTNTALNQSHEVAIISNADGYCLLDMKNLYCIEFQKFATPRKI